MTATVEQLALYTGAGPSDSAYVSECLTEALALVSRFVGSATVPEAVIDRAVIEVGSELFHRRQAPNGIAQFATADGSSAIRVARDPMVSAYPILTPWTGVGVG